jgi:hypothetical protein
MATVSKTDSKSVGPKLNQFAKAIENVKEMRDDAELGSYEVGDSLLLADSEFTSFQKPTEILVSRHFPGYRIFDLVGTHADEALGVLLARTLDSIEALEDFRQLIATPDIATSVINSLFPRVGVPVNRGKYMVSAKMVAERTAVALDGRTTQPNVIAAVSHVITRVLGALDLVLPPPVQKLAATSKMMPISMSDLKKVIMIESLKTVFSETNIGMAVKELKQDSTPNIMAEVIGTMLRHASHAIPQIMLGLEQLEIVQTLIQHYYRDPTQLSFTMRASTSLSTLAAYANFLVDAIADVKTGFITDSTTDQRTACADILTMIQSAPSIEAMSLTAYSAYFGFVPCSAPDGIYMGTVIYMPLNQVSKLDVVDVYDAKGGSEIALIPTEFVPSTTVATEISRTLTSLDAIRGLANLVADEIAEATYGPGDQPILRTIGVSKLDLIYLAMAHSSSTAVVNTMASGFRLVYATKIAEHWRTRLGAATPDVAFFDEPQAVLVYQMGASEILPKAIPARAQSLELTAATDVFYSGDLTEYLVTDIDKSLAFKLELDVPGSQKPITLRLTVNVLDKLVGNGVTIDRPGARYAVIKEPGVDRDVAIALSLASAYADSAQRSTRDKAQSWMVEVLSSFVTHPAVARIAEKALNLAIVEAEVDGRKLQAQYKQLLVRAYFGTAMALLRRFGKLDRKLFNKLVEQVPVDTLSVRASLALATMPKAVNASSLND